jgi:1,4-alpha-glucan branching enzyme
VHPLSALYAVKDVALPLNHNFTPLINYQKKTIEFTLQRKAKSAAITGDFTSWNQTGIPLEMPKDGYWKLCQNLLPPGVYRYKYILNAEEWISDPTNLFQELDGFGGFNSNLIIE